MRFVFTADKILLDQLNSLQISQEVIGEGVSKAEVMVDAVQMLYQIDTLIREGYKFAIISPEGKKYYLRKIKEKEEGDDE